MATARRFAPKVLVASIDEMYLDFSGCERLYGSGGAANGNGGEGRAGDVAIEGAVLQLTTAIFDEIGLPSSAGVATSKVVAKVVRARFGFAAVSLATGRGSGRWSRC